jgi:hypothetical protein
MTRPDQQLAVRGETSRAGGGPRPVAVGVAELRRAWQAAANGQFRRAGSSGDASFQPAGPLAWSPSAGERVVSVVGCAGSCGASTVALALASSAGGPARLVECCPPTASGLAAAPTAELGAKPSGWTEGTRGDSLLIQRVSDPISRPAEVPLPSPAGSARLTVLDVGWPVGPLLSTPCWLKDHIRNSSTVVVVTVATLPGLRRLEAVLPLLGPGALAAAVVGPPLRRWPTALLHSTGAGYRGLRESGRLVVFPYDRRLAVHGLDATPLPAPLLVAARTLRELVVPTAVEGRPR